MQIDVPGFKILTLHEIQAGVDAGMAAVSRLLLVASRRACAIADGLDAKAYDDTMPDLDVWRAMEERQIEMRPCLDGVGAAWLFVFCDNPIMKLRLVFTPSLETGVLELSLTPEAIPADWV